MPHGSHGCGPCVPSAIGAWVESVDGRGHAPWGQPDRLRSARMRARHRHRGMGQEIRDDSGSAFRIRVSETLACRPGSHETRLYKGKATGTQVGFASCSIGKVVASNKTGGDRSGYHVIYVQNHLEYNFFRYGLLTHGPLVEARFSCIPRILGLIGKRPDNQTAKHTIIEWWQKS